MIWQGPLVVEPPAIPERFTRVSYAITSRGAVVFGHKSGFAVDLSLTSRCYEGARAQKHRNLVYCIVYKCGIRISSGSLQDGVAQAGAG